MELTQSFTVAHPRAVVWAYFADVDAVARCMPGAALSEPVSGNSLKGAIAVKLGPISAAFTGAGEFERDDAGFRGVIRGSGRDDKTGSRAKGEVAYVLADEDDGAATRVEVSVAFTLAGPLAQFGRAGIVNDLAARLTAEFASNLEARLDQAATAPAAEAATPEAAPAEPAPAAELDAGALVLSVIWQRIKAFLARLFGRG